MCSSSGIFGLSRMSGLNAGARDQDRIKMNWDPFWTTTVGMFLENAQKQAHLLASVA